jgi:trehalose 6-phosphate synthase/phosphatase
MPQADRLIIASNRLPVTARADGEDVIVEPAGGGVATGLRSLHERSDSVWVGWPGDVSGLPRRARTKLADVWTAQRIAPVPMRHAEVSAFYDSFCNGVLWPLFHYSIDRIPTASAEWDVYREINARFAAAIAAQYRPGDVVWIHDYHLMLVPAMLRFRLPDAAIGFFLHIPFPAAEVFRVLPWRREIVEGILGATLIGFHTDAYARHFVDAVRGLSVHSVEGRTAIVGDRTAQIGAYAMGVDAAWFSATASEPEVVQAAAAMRGTADRQLLVGVDRLDYTKGIPRRLMAYERLLRDNPDLRGRVQLIQLAVPSRGGVASYQQFRHEVEELVGRINGALGTVGWTPIRYLHQSMSPKQLVALYRAADVMLVTPIRDGMNLVAKEFIASRVDEDGVLVLSEFAGASCELRESLIVNPYLVEDMAAAMTRALTMDAAERRRRMAALRQRVASRDRDWWADSFTRDLVHGVPTEARRRHRLLARTGTAAHAARTQPPARPIAACRPDVLTARRVVGWPERIA